MVSAQSKLLSRTILTLLYAGVVVSVSMVLVWAILWFVANHLPGKNICFVWVAFLLSPSFFLLYLVRHARWNDSLRSVKNSFFYCGFNHRYPFRFWLNDLANRPPHEDVNALMEIIEPGDIILRRHSQHLDGLIFRQNSYFTHAGICVIDHPGSKQKEAGDTHFVWHTTSGKNAHKEPLKDFCKCDDVALLRLRLEKLPDRPAFEKMKYSLEKSKLIKVMSEEEEQIFKLLEESVRAGDKDPFQRIEREKLMEQVVKTAEGLNHVEFDHLVDFGDVKQLCCIEYVWRCYLSLFPLHLIKPRYLPYFHVVPVFSLVPDVFVDHPAFECMISDVAGYWDKKQFARNIGKHNLSFIKFLGFLLAWDLIFLLLLVGLVYAGKQIFH